MQSVRAGAGGHEAAAREGLARRDAAGDDAAERISGIRDGTGRDVVGRHGIDGEVLLGEGRPCGQIGGGHDDVDEISRRWPEAHGEQEDGEACTRGGERPAEAIDEESGGGHAPTVGVVARVGLRPSTGPRSRRAGSTRDDYDVEDAPDVDELELDDDADDGAVGVDPPEDADAPVVEESAFLAEPSLDPLDDDESEPDLRESFR